MSGMSRTNKVRVENPNNEPLITRAELLAQVNVYGKPISESTLIYWEQLGKLPRAIRRWRDGKPASLYPRSHIDEVCRVRALRETKPPSTHVKAQPVKDLWRPIRAEDV